MGRGAPAVAVESTRSVNTTVTVCVLAKAKPPNAAMMVVIPDRKRTAVAGKAAERENSAADPGDRGHVDPVPFMFMKASLFSRQASARLVGTRVPRWSA